MGGRDACETVATRCSLAIGTLGVVQLLETAEKAVYTIAEKGELPEVETVGQGCVRRADQEAGR